MLFLVLPSANQHRQHVEWLHRFQYTELFASEQRWQGCVCHASGIKMNGSANGKLSPCVTDLLGHSIDVEARCNGLISRRLSDWYALSVWIVGGWQESVCCAALRLIDHRVSLVSVHILSLWQQNIPGMCIQNVSVWFCFSCYMKLADSLTDRRRFSQLKFNLPPYTHIFWYLLPNRRTFASCTSCMLLCYDLWVPAPVSCPWFYPFRWIVEQTALRTALYYFILASTTEVISLNLTSSVNLGPIPSLFLYPYAYPSPIETD